MTKILEMENVKQYLSDIYGKTVLRDMTGPVDLNAMCGNKVYLVSQHYTYSAITERRLAEEIAQILSNNKFNCFAFYEHNLDKNQIRFAMV